MYQIIRRSEINISKKLSKCPKCNTPYSPLMRIPDEKIFCKNCEDFQFILDKKLIFSHLLAAEMEDKSNLIRLIETMTNPTEFFLSLLIYQNTISNEFFNMGTYPSHFIPDWIHSQYLLELLYEKRIKTMSYNDINTEFEIDWDNFKDELGIYLNFVEKSMAYDRFNRDLMNGDMVCIKKNKGLQGFITDKKYIFGLPLNLYNKLIIENPFHYKNFLLYCQGYSPNILKNIDAKLQGWSLSANIFTKFAKFASVYPFQLNEINNIEYIIRLLSLFYKDDFKSSYFGIDGINIIPKFFFEEQIKLFEKFYTDGIFFYGLDVEQVPFVDLLNQVLSYFSENQNYRKIFYKLMDCMVFGYENIELFTNLMDAQYRIFKQNLRREIRDYRAITNFEQKIWQLGFQLDIQNVFPDAKPILNLKPLSPLGHLELDVGFYKDGDLELIECKTDLAIFLSRQFDYYNKLIKKLKYLRDFFNTKDLTLSEITPSIICQVCIAPPPKGINIFLSEIHLFEYLCRKYGLFIWDGVNFFDKYPIIARIGWENIDILELEPLSLEHFLNDSDLVLYKASYSEDRFHINIKDIEQVIEIKDNLSLNESIEWNKLNLLILKNNKSNSIEDYLFLPPYLLEHHNDNGYYGKSWTYHNSIHGQRFLHLAVKNGIFGYCKNCKIIPLVPIGMMSKPMHSNARGMCPRCKRQFDLRQFDLSSFNDNEDLIQKSKTSIELRLNYLNNYFL